MSHLLESYVDSKVEIITNDGRVMVGTLKGYDQVINIILSECEERVYSSKGVEIVHLGLYVIRGDDVACIGEIDTEIDKELDFTKIKADPLDPVKH